MSKEKMSKGKKIGIAVAVLLGLAIIGTLFPGDDEDTTSTSSSESSAPAVNMSQEEMNKDFNESVFPLIQQSFTNYNNDVIEMANTFDAIDNGELSDQEAYDSLTTIMDKLNRIPDFRIDPPKYFNDKQKNQLHDMFLKVTEAADTHRMMLKKVTKDIDEGNLKPSTVSGITDSTATANEQINDAINILNNLCDQFGVPQENRIQYTDLTQE